MVKIRFIMVILILTRKVDLEVVLARDYAMTMQRVLEGVEDTLEEEAEDKFSDPEVEVETISSQSTYHRALTPGMVPSK